MKKKALILTWSGFQDQEVVYPYYRLLAAEFDVSIVAESRDDKNRIYGIMGVNMPCHLLYGDFQKNLNKYLEEYELLVLPGGVKALEKLRLERFVIEFIYNWNKLGKVIASTCHGAQLLVSAKIVKGRKITGYYSLEDDIVNAGADYSKTPVVIDLNIISSPHYDFMGEWMETVIESFQNK